MSINSSNRPACPSSLDTFYPLPMAHLQIKGDTQAQTPSANNMADNVPNSLAFSWLEIELH